jgi:hypothetical protein
MEWRLSALNQCVEFGNMNKRIAIGDRDARVDLSHDQLGLFDGPPGNVDSNPKGAIS